MTAFQEGKWGHMGKLSYAIGSVSKTQIIKELGHKWWKKRKVLQVAYKVRKLQSFLGLF